MDILGQILIGLLTAFIGFLLALSWQASRRGLTYWRARALWRPFMSGDLMIVIGRFAELNQFEASGLVGVGDMQAAAELAAFFGNLRFRSFDRSTDIVYGDQLAGDLYGANLVCIGGPGANTVTERMLKRIDCTIKFGNSRLHEISIQDTKAGKIYSPAAGGASDSQGDETVTLDFGVLVKTRNPFDPAHNVLIIAGSFGYGTWAGAKLARSAQFLRDPLVSEGLPIECLYKTEVIGGMPQQPQVISLREITRHAKTDI